MNQVYQNTNCEECVRFFVMWKHGGLQIVDTPKYTKHLKKHGIKPLVVEELR